MVLGFYWISSCSMSNPKRTVIYMKKIETLHIMPYIKEHSMDIPIWSEYTYARALYLTGSNIGSQNILRRLVKRQLPGSLKLNVIVILVILFWKSFRKNES